jgi:hypothetical protein
LPDAEILEGAELSPIEELYPRSEPAPLRIVAGP